MHGCHRGVGRGQESELQNQSSFILCAILSFFCTCLLPRVTYTFICLRDVVLPEGKGVCKGSAAGSLLYGTFWTVWERSTLLSRAVKQLLKLLMKAATKVSKLTYRNVCRLQVLLVI